MSIPAGAFKMDCINEMNKAFEIAAGALSNKLNDRNTIELSKKVRNNTAIIPRNGVHLKRLPVTKSAEKKPIIPFERRLGPKIESDMLSSSAPIRTPVSMPFFSPYFIPA